MTQTQTELCYLTIRDAGRLLQSRKLSPVELTRAFLHRIEQLDTKLQSYITVLSDRALPRRVTPKPRFCGETIVARCMASPLP